MRPRLFFGIALLLASSVSAQALVKDDVAATQLDTAVLIDHRHHQIARPVARQAAHEHQVEVPEKLALGVAEAAAHFAANERQSKH